MAKSLKFSLTSKSNIESSESFLTDMWRIEISTFYDWMNITDKTNDRQIKKENKLQIQIKSFKRKDNSVPFLGLIGWVYYNYRPTL